jgi:hypothetical protein
LSKFYTKLYTKSNNCSIPVRTRFRIHNIHVCVKRAITHGNAMTMQGTRLHNSPRVDMSLHSDTLFWFRANQSLLFLLNAACLAEKQQIPILYSLVWPDLGSNPQSIALETSSLTITLPMRFPIFTLFFFNQNFGVLLL